MLVFFVVLGIFTFLVCFFLWYKKVFFFLVVMVFLIFYGNFWKIGDFCDWVIYGIVLFLEFKEILCIYLCFEALWEMVV